MVKLTEYKNDEWMVKVSQKEAMELVESLVHQININNCNLGRKEFLGQGKSEPKYFSVAVEEQVDD